MLNDPFILFFKKLRVGLGGIMAKPNIQQLYGFIGDDLPDDFD